MFFFMVTFDRWISTLSIHDLFDKIRSNPSKIKDLYVYVYNIFMWHVSYLYTLFPWVNRYYIHHFFFKCKNIYYIMTSYEILQIFWTSKHPTNRSDLLQIQFRIRWNLRSNLSRYHWNAVEIEMHYMDLPAASKIMCQEKWFKRHVGNFGRIFLLFTCSEDSMYWSVNHDMCV